LNPGPQLYEKIALSTKTPAFPDILSDFPQSDVPRDVPDCIPTTLTTDPDLSRVIEAWATLPEPIRRAVVAIIASVNLPAED
jgi:hypothetical protein